MAGGQAIEGAGVSRGVIHACPPEMLEYDVKDGHPLHEVDRARIEEIDEELVLSIMALGVNVPIQIAVAKSAKGVKSYVVVDGRRRVVNAIEANRRLKKQGEPLISVPVLVIKGDESKLSEVMIALNELQKPHSIMVKAQKAAMMLDRVKDQDRVARAFGVEPQTITIWVKLAGMSAYAKKLADEGHLKPSAIVKFAELAPAEQREALEKFLTETAETGVKPTAARARAATKGAKNGTSHAAGGGGNGLTPSKRFVRALIERDELRKHLDPLVIKTLRWIFGELDPKNIGGLTGALSTLEDERKEKIAKAKARAKAKAAAAAKPAKAEAPAEATS